MWPVNLPGALRAALSSCRALWAFGVQSWSATRSGGLSSQGSKKGGSFEPPSVSRFCPAVGRCRPAPQKGWVSAVDSHPVRLRVAGVFPALLLLEDVRWAFWTPAVVAGVFVGRRRLHGSYTTASTAAALGFQPVVPETVARSLKAVGFLGVAPGSWDFRRMERRAIKPIIAQRTGVSIIVAGRRRAEKLSLEAGCPSADPPRAVRRAASSVGMVSARSIVAARRWPRVWVSWATPSSADSNCQVVNPKCSATMLG